MHKVKLFPTVMILLSLCAGCNDYFSQVAKQPEKFSFVFSTADEVSLTKTTLSDSILNWSNGDVIGIFVDNLQYNVPFSFYSTNTFWGYFNKLGVAKSSVKYIGYYPWVETSDSSNVVDGVLPFKQKAPFDCTADYIVSNPVDASYDESNMPSLSFNFDNHLFSIIKVPITNSGIDAAQYSLNGITIKAEGVTLAGDFSFDVFDAVNSISFTSDEYLKSDEVWVDFDSDERPLLGTNETHIIYAVVNSTEVADIKIDVFTSGGNYTKTISLNKTLKRGYITNLDPIDVVSMTPAQHKSLVYWGDSNLRLQVTNYLSKLLGDNWTVVNCGVPGGSPYDISGNQGGAPLCFNESFTIPGDASESVEFSNIWSTFTKSGDSTGVPQNAITCRGSYTFGKGNTSHFNNCQVCGVECVIEIDETVTPNQLSIHRAESGEPVIVTPGTRLYSYGSLNYRDADVVVCYMGPNNGGLPNNTTALASFYQCMMNYATSGRFIVGGFHYVIPKFRCWTQEFADLFNTQFGDQFLDFKTVGSHQGVRLLIETGRYSSKSEIPALDMELINGGYWPASLQTSYTDNVHVNGYGHKALAIMVYEKMRKLGYLSE